MSRILSVLVILILVFIIIIWSFDITSSDRTEDSFIKNSKEVISEINKLFKEFKEEVRVFQNKTLSKPLTNEEILRLKEKVLKEYRETESE